MTLLVTLFAAIVSSVVWYRSLPSDSMKVGVLCLIYWGASLMWLVDAVFGYVMFHASFFAPAPLDMLNDAFLGFSAVALGLVIWLAILLVKDPQGKIKTALFKAKRAK